MLMGPIGGGGGGRRGGGGEDEEEGVFREIQQQTQTGRNLKSHYPHHPQNSF
jgi:hypothetical protein